MEAAKLDYDPETGEVLEREDDAPKRKTTKKPTPSARDRRDAAASVAAKIVDGDKRAAQRIAKTLVDLDDAQGRLSEVRKEFKAKVDVAHARFRGAVQADDDGTDRGARAKLDEIVDAFQEEEELVAQRKDEVSLASAAVKELKERLKKQVEGARQLGLFGD